MNWTDLAVTVQTADLERAEELVSRVQPEGIYTEDYSTLEQDALEIAHIDLIEESLLQKDRMHAVIHVYIQGESPEDTIVRLQSELSGAGIAYELHTGVLQQEDWENNWKQYYHQTKVGKRLLICPEWETPENHDGRAVLRLEPGLAFGTGTHATTRLCLEQLEPYITSETELLDVGCGSGILAISACLLGCRRAVGVDIDPYAVRTAAENGEKNGFGTPELLFLQGDLTEAVSGTYDVIVSNIVADVILILCPDVGSFLRPGGIWIVSGIILDREPDLRAAFAEQHLRIVGRREQDGWVSFVLTKCV